MIQRLKCEQLPIFVASAQLGGWERRSLSESVTAYLLREMPILVAAQTRGVSFECLPYILKHGCDVEPTDSVMYIADGLDKALEYGADGDQVIQFFGKHLEQTFKEVPITTPLAELEALSELYPTRLTSKDEQYYWLSRLPPDHPGLASGYEIAYARWIPGDPFESLLGLMIVGEDFQGIMTRTRELLREFSRET